MTSPSQVYMAELQSFMTPAYIINAFQKLGHHPISATLQKKRKNDEKEICIIQFANDDAAKQAVFKLNGKAIPNSGYNAAKFKLSQCMGNRTAEHNVWVGDLTLDVDDYHFFKFFAQHYKTLTSAKVIVDGRNVSRGYGFLRFYSEEEQKHCLKNMGGSLGLGCRPIRVGPVSKQNATHGNYVSETVVILDDDTQLNGVRIENDPWSIYTSWNRFNQPTEYYFIAAKPKTPFVKDDVDPRQDLRLIDYNVAYNPDDLNKESIEKDCYLWDALECTKWLPENALATAS